VGGHLHSLLALLPGLLVYGPTVGRLLEVEPLEPDVQLAEALAEVLQHGVLPLIKLHAHDLLGRHESVLVRHEILLAQRLPLLLAGLSEGLAQPLLLS